MHALQSEIDYLLDVYTHYFPDRDTTVVGDMAGCRVLPGAEGNSLFKRSRETVFEQDRPEQARIISIVGGKLTVYRQTALDALQRLEDSLPSRARVANTAELALKPA